MNEMKLNPWAGSENIEGILKKFLYTLKLTKMINGVLQLSIPHIIY